jgi:hypothetical protein
LRTAELFLQGKDGARARLILDFMQSRLRRAPTSSRWAVVRKGLAKDYDEAGQPITETKQSDSPVGSALESVAADLRAAREALVRAQALLEENGLGEIATGPASEVEAPKAEQP